MAEREARDLVLAALAAADRIREVVDSVSSQADATSKNLVALSQAVEGALGATNERLALIESFVLGDDVGPGRDAAERAMARLRGTLRRSATDAGNGAGRRAPPSSER